MSWSTVQLKYQLVRISEILISWARFTKPTLVSEIDSTRAELLINDWALEDLEAIKDSFWEFIMDHADRKLFEDLKGFFKETQYHTDPTSFASMTD